MIPKPSQLKKTLLAAGTLLSLNAAALDPTFYADTTPLSSGRWVKIGVTDTGIQQITAAELADMGFDDPERVAVYGFSAISIADHELSAAHPDGLPPVPSIVHDGKLIFYGEGGFRPTFTYQSSYIYTSYKQNQSSATGYYFLTEEDAPRRLEAKARNAVGTPITSAHSYTMQNFLDDNPFTSGAYLLSKDLSDGVPFTVKLYAPHLDPTVKVSFSTRYVLDWDTITFTWPDGTTLKSSNKTGSVYTKEVRDKVITPNDDNIYSVNIQTSESDYAAIDYLSMTYRRQLLFAEGESQMELLFHETLAAGRPFEFAGTDPGELEMWDITDPSSPARLSVAGSTNGTRAINANAYTNASTAPTSHFIAFNPSGKLHSVTMAGEVTSASLHSLQTPEMIIIAPPAFTAEAAQLAELHQMYQTMDVAVAVTTDIFNEFSSGTPSADGLRRFVKMLYDRNPGKLRHVLLLGSTFYDPRGLLGIVAPDPEIDVLSYSTESLADQIKETKSYCTDTFFGNLTDGQFSVSNPMKVNVGRIPALAAGQARIYIDKISRYFAQPPSPDVLSRVISMADRGNKNGHVNQAEEICSIITKENPNTVITKAYDPLFEYINSTCKPLVKEVTPVLNSGTSYMTYCGHAHALAIGSQLMWQSGNVQNTDYDIQPFVMLSTCNTFPFDRQLTSIGEQMLFKSAGGAIALVGAGRTVQMNFNQELNTRVAREFFKRSQSTTMGDVFRTAHNDIMLNGLSGLRTNTLCYSFGGDPALPLYGNTHSIAIETNAADTGLSPMSSSNTFAGSVTVDNNTDTSFDGTLTATLYLPATVKKMLNHDSTDTLKDITCQSRMVATARFPVKAGRFSFNMPVPQVATEGAGFKLIISAQSADGRSAAVMALNDVTVEALDPEADHDTTGPEIAELYVDDRTFVNGDLLDGSAILYARILPSPNGLSTGNSLTRTPYLEIDGARTSLALNLKPDADGSTTLAYPLDRITDGQHTATLSVSDYAGNRTEETLSFSLIRTPAEATLSVDRLTGAEEVTVTLDHTFEAEPQGRLNVVDRDGNTVFTAVNPSYPFTWDLRDNSGERVADGHYTIHAWLRHQQSYATATPAEIVIIED